MTSHCTSPSASSKWRVMAGSATLTAMSSGASDAPRPTMARPKRGDVIPRPQAAGSSGLTPLSEVLAQERHRAVPGLLGGARIERRTRLVGEGMLGVVAVDVWLVAGFGHLRPEFVDELRRAPIVDDGEVALDGDLDPGGIGGGGGGGAPKRGAPRGGPGAGGGPGGGGGPPGGSPPPPPWGWGPPRRFPHR